MSLLVFIYNVENDDRAVAILNSDQVIKMTTTARGTTVVSNERDIVVGQDGVRGANITSYALPTDETIREVFNYEDAISIRNELIEELKEKGTLATLAFPSPKAKAGPMTQGKAPGKTIDVTPNG